MPGTIHTTLSNSNLAQISKENSTIKQLHLPINDEPNLQIQIIHNSYYYSKITPIRAEKSSFSIL